MGEKSRNNFFGALGHQQDAAYGDCCSRLGILHVGVSATQCWRGTSHAYDISHAAAVEELTAQAEDIGEGRAAQSLTNWHRNRPESKLIERLGSGLRPNFKSELKK